MSDLQFTIEMQIRHHIAENQLLTGDDYKLGNDTSFLEEGIIDSIGIMELVEFVSKTFSINIPPEDITPDHFDSIRKIQNYISMRQGVVSA